MLSAVCRVMTVSVDSVWRVRKNNHIRAIVPIKSGRRVFEARNVHLYFSHVREGVLAFQKGSQIWRALGRSVTHLVIQLNRVQWNIGFGKITASLSHLSRYNNNLL